jgi:hypothetical protein
MIATEPKCNCLSQELWGDEAHLVSCPRSKLYSSPSPTEQIKTKPSPIKEKKEYCVKHQLFHGQKYPSCIPTPFTETTAPKQEKWERELNQQMEFIYLNIEAGEAEEFHNDMKYFIHSVISEALTAERQRVREKVEEVIGWIGLDIEEAEKEWDEKMYKLCKHKNCHRKVKADKRCRYCYAHKK